MGSKRSPGYACGNIVHYHVHNMSQVLTLAVFYSELLEENLELEMMPNFKGIQIYLQSNKDSKMSK